MCRFSSEASAKISFLIPLLQVIFKLFLKIFRPPFLRLFSISNRFSCEAVAKVRLCFLFPNFVCTFYFFFSGLDVVRSQQPSYLMTKARSYNYDQA